MTRKKTPTGGQGLKTALRRGRLSPKPASSGMPLPDGGRAISGRTAHRIQEKLIKELREKQET